jgi:hypothetical protein
LVAVPAALEEAQAAHSAQEEEVRAEVDRVEGSAGVAEALEAEEERVVGAVIAPR